MSTEVQADLVIEVQPDIPETNETAEKPEVAEQESEEQAVETAEERAKRYEREAHALRRKNDKLNAKYRAEQEVRQRLEQTQGDRNQDRQVSPEQQEQALTREIEAVVTVKNLIRDNPKFADHIKTIAEEVGPVVQVVNGHEIPSDLLEGILDCEKPAKVAAYLAQNPEVAEELDGLNPKALARRLGQLEDRLKAAPKVSSAPEPIKPIGQRGSGGTKTPDQMTDREFAEWRRKQIKSRN